MTYVSVITLVTYALVLGLLAVVSVIDIRSRRVPNGLAAALGFLWVASVSYTHLDVYKRQVMEGPSQAEAS